MAENYLTLVKSFVRKNGLHNIISIHTMAINEHRINFFVETKEEPKVEAIKAVLTDEESRLRDERRQRRKNEIEQRILELERINL